MPDLYPPRLVHNTTLTRARALRRDSTDAERRLWAALRNRKLSGWKFRRQYSIGDYIVDFCRIEGRLVVELDGEQHQQRQKEYDDARTREIERRGFRVLRFENFQVTEDEAAVLQEILRRLGGDGQ